MSAPYTLLRMLVVEDSQDDFDLLVRLLEREGFVPDAVRVDSAEALQRALDDDSWKLVIADYSMPGFSGTRALEMVRGRGLDVPFIFVSGTIGEDTAVRAMQAGAQDYVLKGNLKRLPPAVRRELREAERRQEQARSDRERRAADRRLRHMLDAAPDAVIVADHEQRIVMFNEGAERIFGYRTAEVLGQPLTMLLPEAGHAAHAELMRRVDAEPAPLRRLSGEVLGRRSNGEEFPAEASLSRLADGDSRSYTVILRDIGRRKRVEQRLRLLQQLNAAIGEAADVHAALSVTLQRVCETTGWALAQSWLPAPDGRLLECSPAWHCREPGLESFRMASLARSVGPGEGLPGRVWASRRAEWVADLAGDGGLVRGEAACKAGLKAGLAVPVLANEQVVAVLEFFVTTPRDAEEELIALVGSVAAQLGGAIQRKRAEQRLQYLAHHDSLTGLANRVLFRERLQQVLAEAARHQRTVGVAFVDLDRFKTINDSLGHELGDRLLAEVAERLRRCLREEDTLARLSGDEFAVVLAQLRRPDDAARVAQKLADAFATPFRVAGHELYSSASVGVTLYPTDAGDADALLRNADIAMYRAKELGGNGYQFYAPGMTARARQRLALEGALRAALADEAFVLHYQPVVDLRSGRVERFEALLRWQHRDRGLVPPGEFIPVAEETGMIQRIGDWVLENACRRFAAVREASVAVNVSPRQFSRRDLPHQVAATLRRSGLQPERLELEITENLLMSHSDQVLGALYELAGQGVSFSVDDFGTGYCNLSYLRRLPLRALKIDRSFVAEVTTDASTAAVVRGMISLAHDLGLVTVAEGVESTDQLEFLREHGCDKAQGFLFSAPRPDHEIPDMLSH